MIHDTSDPFAKDAKPQRLPSVEKPTPLPGESVTDAYMRSLRESQDRGLKMREAQAMKTVGTRKGVTNFSTQQGIDYNKSLGWKLRHREASVAYKDSSGEWKRRWQDLPMAMDAEFSRMGMLIGCQYAGEGEELAHWRKFEGLGGVQKAKEIYSEVWYYELRRGVAEPVKARRWL